MSRVYFSVVTACVLAASATVAAQQPRRGQPDSTVARTSPARIDVPRLLPGTPADVFTSIQGNALTSDNGSLANAVVRLRDARIGRIMATQMTDRAGLFAFRSLDPGSYIVELVAPDEASVLAASQVLNLGAGQAVSAVVKLPFRLPPFAGLLGNSIPSAAAVAGQAAASGVLATQVSGAGTCDTLQ
jgi:hypothetical protein